MDTIMSKICLSLLICSLLSTKEVCSQSNCSWPPSGGDFTNGPSAELITANDGVSLLGIRVLWTIKSEYLNCPSSSLMVHLVPGGHSRVATVNDSSADFYNLDCNTEYTPSVRMVVSGVRFQDVGDSLFFGDTQNTVPSQLSRVCAGPGSPLSSLTRVNISWDLLPCHLENGGDITGYIIQYSPTSGGVSQNISSSEIEVDCGVESGGPYRCLLSSSLSTIEVSYSFQVAAVNRYGTGPFSGHVNSIISGTESDTNCYTMSRPPYSEPSTKVTNDSESEEMSHSTSTAVPTDVSASSPAWIIVAGSLLIIVIILVGVIIMLVTLVFILWKRLKFTKISKADQTNAKLDESKMDMKECSAYGHVTSTKTTSADEQHVYESTN